jgi:hypothetical protein
MMMMMMMITIIIRRIIIVVYVPVRQYPCCLLQDSTIATPTPNIHRIPWSHGSPRMKVSRSIEWANLTASLEVSILYLRRAANQIHSPNMLGKDDGRVKVGGMVHSYSQL